jgi:tetratricopeptide (TPR) repeat protein
MRRPQAILTFLLVMIASCGYCQQTVFALMKNDVAQADEYFRSEDYHEALKHYQHGKKAGTKEIQLKIAACYYYLKDYSAALTVYMNYRKLHGSLPTEALQLYTEATMVMGDHNEAIAALKLILASDPENELAMKKIWRLSNLNFLYDDSMHYAVRPISINSEYGELCAVPYRDGIVFVSNRKVPQLVARTTAALNTPFYQLYFSRIVPDTSAHTEGALTYQAPAPFQKTLSEGLHKGPVSLCVQANVMAYTASHEQTSAKQTHLGIYFSKMAGERWTIDGAFPYNSESYSNSGPSLRKDGNTLYFASDMPGGYGGKDIYKSTLISGEWSKPENLGEVINTKGDEVFPYVHNENTLYFSSDGHAGMGGLDIFKAVIRPDGGFEEAQNAGYPLNSTFDDFGITVDPSETHGYFSSNRRHGKYDDDLYEFDMDLQTYPVTITGILKYKEHTWSDSSHLMTLPNARIELVDNLRHVNVHETVSDAEGNFSLTIPYFSNYIVKVTAADGEENLAVLQIPKQRKQLSSHEIVLVKDFFKSHEIQEVK